MFVGRKEQLADLMTLWRKRTSSIVACRGRRRIGKSTLFREFARRSADVYIEIEGLVVAEVEEKVRRMPFRKGLSARPVLVYDGELLPSVEGSGYFDAIINARQLLEV